MENNLNDIKQDNVVLLSGRVGVGKTEMLIAYANLFIYKTLFISFECNEETLQKRGLNKSVKVMSGDINIIDMVNITKYDTYIFDYLELVGINYNNKLIDFIQLLMRNGKRIILATQMKRSSFEINNLFEKIAKKS